MAGSNQRALIAQIVKLRERQLEDISNATFIGWTLNGVIAHDQREREIAELVRQLAILDETSFLKGS